LGCRTYGVKALLMAVRIRSFGKWWTTESPAALVREAARDLAEQDGAGELRTDHILLAGLQSGSGRLVEILRSEPGLTLDALRAVARDRTGMRESVPAEAERERRRRLKTAPDWMVRRWGIVPPLPGESRVGLVAPARHTDRVPFTGWQEEG
jgi:hypothetical protein